MTHAVIKRDPEAQAEFHKRHGIINPDIPMGNAAALQRAHRASLSRAVQKASLLVKDDEASAALDRDALSEQLGGDLVLDAAVRGNAVVVVAVDANGRSYKTVVPANASYVAPSEDPDEAAEREYSLAEQEFHAALAAQRDEHAAEIQALRDEQARSVAALREEILGGARTEAVHAEAEATAGGASAPAPAASKKSGKKKSGGAKS